MGTIPNPIVFEYYGEHYPCPVKDCRMKQRHPHGHILNNRDRRASPPCQSRSYAEVILLKMEKEDKITLSKDQRQEVLNDIAISPLRQKATENENYTMQHFTYSN